VPTAVSVITRVALDHTHVLGDNLADIATEKAGILRAETPAVIGARAPEALAAIEAVVARLGTDAWRLGRELQAERGERGTVRVQVGGRVFSALRVGLLGEHQLDNVACAVAAIERLRVRGIRVPEPALRRGLARVRWPARLEVVSKKPRIVLDAAHNEDGCEALARYLTQDDPFLTQRARGKRVLVFGALLDKSYAAMLARLAPLFDRVIVCRAPVEQAASLAQLARGLPPAAGGKRVPCSRAKSVADALARGRRSAGLKGELVVAGSIFLVAEARARLLGVRQDPAIRM
jgi:dihydrofolate synthase/folylpolyglutamate synthase